MEPIYGNHLGIVINDQDPEHRSRLQVFIPHLSNTLYSDWNGKIIQNNNLDIGFKTFEDGVFNGDIKQKLKNILPWSEAAVPSFGGGTSGPVNTALGKAAVDMAKGLAATGNLTGAALMTGANAVAEQIANQPTSPLYASQNGKNVISDNSAASYRQIAENAIAKAQANGSLIVSKNIAGQKDKISGDANGNRYSVQLEGGYTADGRQIGDPNTSFRYADGSSLDGMKVPYVVVPRQYYGYPVAVSINGNPPIIAIGGDGGGIPWTPGGNSNTEVSIATLVGAGGGVIQASNGLLTGTTLGPNDTLVLTPITDGSIPILKSGRATQEEVDAIYGGQLTDDQKNQLDSMVANAANRSGERLVAGNTTSSSRPVQRQFAATTLPPPTNAKGFFSKPVVGAKVWVFFHGGDIQRPVYFATAMESVGSTVAYQPTTT